MVLDEQTPRECNKKQRQTNTDTQRKNFDHPSERNRDAEKKSRQGAGDGFSTEEVGFLYEEAS